VEFEEEGTSENEQVKENAAKELVQLMDFEEEGQYEEKTSENEHVEENISKELVQLMDFEEEG
jgi:hypothetical protein